LRSHDVVNDLMGSASYTAALLLAVTGDMPTDEDVRLLDAVLVSLLDHGMQPSALVARLTYHAAPEALQGAMAAGLLGAGSVILGGMEAAGKLLSAVVADSSEGGDVTVSALAHVERILGNGERVPGFGHALHRGGDPRATRLTDLAGETHVAETELTCLSAVADAVANLTQRELQPNVTGVGAALLLGLGIPWQLHRGIAVVSRAAGVLAHIGEELRRPLAPEIRSVLRSVGWLEP
jgi:citrate synthase